jgi:hypothetical protein
MVKDSYSACSTEAKTFMMLSWNDATSPEMAHRSALRADGPPPPSPAVAVYQVWQWPQQVPSSLGAEWLVVSSFSVAE